MLRTSAISIEKLRAGKFKKDLPEFYELKRIIQNNKWHANDSVFSHTLSVLKNMENDIKTNPQMKSYFHQVVDVNTREDILFLAALLHDIAKKETLDEKYGKTSFKGHEKLGSEKANKILDRFDLSKKEKDMVIRIIENHDLIHHIVEPENKEAKEQLSNLRKNFSDIFLDLVILGMADTQGSHLKDNYPKEFDYRMKLYNEFISR